MTQQDHISRKRVVYTIAGMEAVTMRQVEYRATAEGSLTLDVYAPAATPPRPQPAVVFVTGFSDRGAEKMVGCRFKEMGSYISWAQLAAASGMIGITYDNADPEADAHAALAYVRTHAGELQVDPTRLGVWSCSGHAANALALLMNASARCAALFYPYTLDLDGSTHVAAASTQFRFVNASAGKTVEDLPRELPLFLARAGQDQMPGLNQALDRFTTHALSRNLPLTVMNHPHGPHAFDLFDDSPPSRDIVRQSLAFLAFHLRH